MIYIGIDQSKRSTALVALDDNGRMVEFRLIAPGMELDNEALIARIWQEIEWFIHNMIHTDEEGEVCVAIEGLAYSANSSSTDLLFGIQWYIRTRIFTVYPDVLVGVLTAATWRSVILPVEDQRRFKLHYGGKIGLKHGVVSKLPTEVYAPFKRHLESRRLELNIKKGLKTEKSEKYLDCLFDLADAWGIAKHRLLLDQGYIKPKKVPVKKTASKLKRRFPNAS